MCRRTSCRLRYKIVRANRQQLQSIIVIVTKRSINTIIIIIIIDGKMNLSKLTRPVVVATLAVVLILALMSIDANRHMVQATRNKLERARAKLHRLLDRHPELAKDAKLASTVATHNVPPNELPVKDMIAISNDDNNSGNNKDVDKSADGVATSNVASPAQTDASANKQNQ